MAATLYALGFWFLGTGVILYLDGLPRRTHAWSFFFCTVLFAVALAGLAATRDDMRGTGAYIAFTCAMLVWAWQEMAFLLGYVTGPRRRAEPPGARGWRRAGYALLAILYHELLLLVLGTTVVLLTWGGENQVGTWTFAALWLMRLSAKLNVFLGVRNLSESFLPEHLRYLQSYFRRRPSNGLFPVSVLLSSLLAVWVWQGGLALGDGAYERAAAGLVGTLLALAVLEHAFMVIPLDAGQALWRWSLRGREGSRRRTAADS